MAGATFAPMYLLSANGTLRTILILLILWQLLRIWSQSRRAQQPGPRHWTDGPPRRRGEVRIEQAPPSARRNEARPGTTPRVEDADFEEIR